MKNKKGINFSDFVGLNFDQSKSSWHAIYAYYIASTSIQYQVNQNMFQLLWQFRYTNNSALLDYNAELNY